MNVTFERVGFIAAWVALAAAAALFVAGSQKQTAEAERPMAGVESLFNDPLMNTLFNEQGLRAAAARGDKVAIARLASMDTTLAALRARATVGDASAAQELSSILGWVDENASLDVLRLPAVRDDDDVQQSRMMALSGSILTAIRNCKPVDQALFKEYVELLNARATKGDWLAERDLLRLNAITDPTSPRQVMEAFKRDDLLKGCPG